jgi:starch synthase (maltosyl-transferring)
MSKRIKSKAATNVVTSQTQPSEGRARVVIERVWPELDAGRFPVKRVVGEVVRVEADIFADGHDAVSAAIAHHPVNGKEVLLSPMHSGINDRWHGEFTVTEVGTHTFTVVAWVDHFKGWRRDLRKRVDAGQDTTLDYLIGAKLVSAAAGRARGADAHALKEAAEKLGAGEAEGKDLSVPRAVGLSEELNHLMEQHPDRSFENRFEREILVAVDPERARFSTWYETFPRSCSEVGHGTFKDVASRLKYISDMGFDVLYLPPIHPIGTAFRKGKNNSLDAQPDDVGSPWAIGAKEGGHKDVHPALGTMEDFRDLVHEAHRFDMRLALDIAFQCSPDHPYVTQHPDWFKIRPDGTIQYAENPPKKYQDIYPFDFECQDWQGLWNELKSIFEFWIEKGVTIFRVDNPHTKPFAFWEWCIGDLKAKHPELIFLAEAFTRPKVMSRLAKLGFTQSYTYFAWRNSKWELTQYLNELVQGEAREFFRPNFWPNTPDILTEQMQHGGRGAFMSRVLLAGTLAASYGIYGPAYELCENRARERGSEEYLDSEKYQVRQWDLRRVDSLRPVIARLNWIRRTNAALQTNETLRFHETENEQIICYSKRSLSGGNTVVVIVNLDPNHQQSGFVNIPVHELGLDPHRQYSVHDLLTDEKFSWTGTRNFVQLDPRKLPGHIFRISQHA